MISFDVQDAVAVVRIGGAEASGALSGTVLSGLGDAFGRVAAEQPRVRAVILTGADGAGAPGESVGEVCWLIERCRAPVIGVIEGRAAGAGLKLVLACHLRVASAGARLVLPETESGGGEISAAEALRAGLLNRVVEPGQVVYEAHALAREIKGLAPLAIGACLEAVTRGLKLPLDEGLALEAELFSGLFDTEDVREGTLAFLEKRAPVFKGK